MRIKYGLIHNNIDVTDICKEKLLTNNIITIPKGDSNRAYHFTDPIPNIKKKIIIENNDIVTEFNEYLEVKLNIIDGTINNISPPVSLDINLNTPIIIFWHIYVDKNRMDHCIYIIQRQFQKIVNSGLLNRCKNLYIGYVSEIPFPCQDILNSPKVKIIIRFSQGNEGVTTSMLKKFCDELESESLIMYIHNRGATKQRNTPSEDWTLCLEYFIIEEWKNSIILLEKKYTCGCWLFPHKPRAYSVFPSGKNVYHYGGNMWWSRSSYIKKLPYPTFENRYVEGEDWILQLIDDYKPNNFLQCFFGILHQPPTDGTYNGYLHRYPREKYVIIPKCQ